MNCASATGSTSRAAAKHGALLDAELLAEVYVELIGGRQASLVLVETGRATAGDGRGGAIVLTRPQPLAPRLTDEERAAHMAFVASLGDKAIWRGYQLSE